MVNIVAGGHCAWKGEAQGRENERRERRKSYRVRPRNIIKKILGAKRSRSFYFYFISNSLCTIIFLNSNFLCYFSFFCPLFYSIGLFDSFCCAQFSENFNFFPLCWIVIKYLFLKKITARLSPNFVASLIFRIGKRCADGVAVLSRHGQMPPALRTATSPRVNLRLRGPTIPFLWEINLVVAFFLNAYDTNYLT